MKKFLFVLVALVLVLAIGHFATTGYLSLLSPPTNSKAIQLNVEVGEPLLINADTHWLNFGKISSGGFAEKSLLLSNEEDTTCLFAVSISGPISPWITTERSFSMGPNSEKSLLVNLEVPEDAAEGPYRGELLITWSC